MKKLHAYNSVAGAALTLSLLISAPTMASNPFHTQNNPNCVESTQVCTKQLQPKKTVSDYFKEFPWIGLITDEITYGPATVSHIHIDKGDKLAVVKPGETLHGTLRYKLDTADQEKFHRCHLVVGIKDVGAQDCIAHTFNLWESKGKGHFELKAPTEPGVYQVRFAFIEGLTCESARDAWNDGQMEPSAAATIGVIVVE